MSKLTVEKASNALKIIQRTRESLLFKKADVINSLIAFRYISQTLESKVDIEWADFELNGFQKQPPAYREVLAEEFQFTNVPKNVRTTLQKEKHHTLYISIPRLIDVLEQHKDERSVLFGFSDEQLKGLNKRFNTKITYDDIAVFLEKASVGKLLTVVNLEIIKKLQSLEDLATDFLHKHRDEIPQKKETKIKYDPKKIFMVHGRDDNSRNELYDILKNRFNLDPIVLMDKANEGKTLIEKFENHSLNVGYAFVLLTPDDLGCLESEFSTILNKNPKKAIEVLEPRARQNVLLELGYFVGKLGRNRVCCIQKGDVDLLPADLHGLVTIRFNDSVKDKYLDIEDELKKIGYVKR